MAKIIAINRKYFTVFLSALLVCLLGIAGVTLWKTTQASANGAVPEVKMLGVAVEPGSFTQDLTYGTVTIKSSQVINTNKFDLIATVQNTTGGKMTNIPIELEVSLVGDDKQKVSKIGTLPSLDPGATARVAFREIKSLGDAAGKSATDGQHKITLRVKPNVEGGITQNTEASFFFNVDSTVKSPSGNK
ncbi:MAG: hypothetical protein ACRKFN_07845 [Desulfitobacterium sp.]